jgi:putative addiction module component (TIGR02574 family)
MPRAAEEILKEALQLPEDDRERIADSLLLSVQAGLGEPIEQAWIDEANRRMVEIDEGRTQLVPGDQVMSHLRARFVR